MRSVIRTVLLCGLVVMAVLAASVSCATHADAPLTLPFDENGGAVTKALGDVTVSGTLKNGAAWTPGIHGSAVALDAKQEQYVELDCPAVNMRASFTVSVWIKMSSITGDQAFVSQSGPSGGGFMLGKSGEHNRLAFTLSEDNSLGAPPQTVTSDFAPTPGLWYEVVGVYDNAAKQMRLYANGTPLGASPAKSASSTFGPTEIGCVRAGANVPTDCLDGAADEVQFSARAFSDKQVTAQYQADLNRFRPRTFTWANPIYFQGRGPNDDVRDPAILQDKGVFYIVYTMWPFRNYTDRDPKLPDMGSSPGIALYSSRDLKVWKFQNWLLKSSALPMDCPYKHQFWAPEIHKFDRRYYLIFGGSNWLKGKYNIGGHMGYSQFVGVSDRICGPYAHVTALKGPGVDTSLFQDDDGKTYAVWPRNEIHPIDLTRIDQGTVTVGPKLSQAATDADFAAIGKPVPETIEGPYLIKRHSTYYCFFAETYRGPNGFYDTGVATAASLAGPWTLDPRWRIFPGGHQALFIGPDGRRWTSYKHEESGFAPWLSIDPLDFDADGAVRVTTTDGPQSISLSRHEAIP